MKEDESPKRFDLEERTFAFAKRVREFVKRLSKTTGNVEDSRQLIRSSGSVGANYIEANEPFSKKDFVLRIKICRKEAKESRYWLRLIEAIEESLASERDLLAQEAQELMNIFGAIVRKSERLLLIILIFLFENYFGFRYSYFRKSQLFSSSSSNNCCLRRCRADFLIARRSVVTACFSACRSFRVRLSILPGRCEIFGRSAPTFRSLGFAYGFHEGILGSSELLSGSSLTLDAPPSNELNFAAVDRPGQ
jgi:four helix bundle protein